MWRYTIDYTSMPLGKQTRQGIVSDCPECGRRGAMMRWTWREHIFERWVHLERGRFLIRTEQFGCSREVFGPFTDPLAERAAQ
jgi:hypothetical protein